ncbi:nibrin [Microplitis demolitor]|uniref:nibrin n=1 Tax=Microplitis demolitor TaxID=69319 RepID=UPI0004CDA246|nr:nibrin [Microplitis demolitor]
MWLLVDSSKNIKKLNSGDTITFGRSNTDIVLSNDASISRNHAKLQVITEDKTEKLFIKDIGSKYGTYLLNDDEKSEQFKITNEGYNVKSNDKIRFGLRNHIYSLIYKPTIKYHVLISRVHGNDKNNLENIFEKIGGKILNSWSDECTHLTTTKTGITEKVACALASGIPIVNINYWDDLLKAKEETGTIPDLKKYMPPLDNSFLDDKQATLSPNLMRKKIFNGLIFYHFEKLQRELYSTMIRLAGGRSFVFDESVKVEDTVEDNVIIVQPSDDIETQSSSFEHFQKISMELARNKLRTIPSTEIALAIFYCSTEKYCNPKFKYRKLFKSTKPTVEENKMKFPVVAQDTQDLDNSPKVLKSQRIIPESVPLDFSVIENPRVSKNKLNVNVDRRKKSLEKIDKSRDIPESSSRNLKNIELCKKNDVEVGGKDKTDESDQILIAIDNKNHKKTAEPAGVQKSAEIKVKESRTKKNDDIEMDDGNVEIPEILKKNKLMDNKKTDKSAVNLRENEIEKSRKNKLKDAADNLEVDTDNRKNHEPETRKRKSIDEDVKNKTVWDILSNTSQHRESRAVDSDDDIKPDVSNIWMGNSNSQSKERGQKRKKITHEEEGRDKENGIVKFVYIGRQIDAGSSTNLKINHCRKNKCCIPKRRLKREDMYVWDPKQKT